jgi:cell wall-associated NlpC family hydrolase
VPFQPLIRAVSGALLLAASLGALAAPDAAPTVTDPVMRLLSERGLLDAAQQASQAPIVQQVRDRASELVLSAMNFLGVPYRRGGTTEDGFDCSGFTRRVFESSIGLVLPRRASEQAKAPGLVPVVRDELKPGDLVFFNTLRRAFSHVGIYIGEGKFIHAPHSGAEVRVEDMRATYWTKRFNGARRADLAAAPKPDTGDAPAPEAAEHTPAAH